MELVNTDGDAYLWVEINRSEMKEPLILIVMFLFVFKIHLKQLWHKPKLWPQDFQYSFTSFFL